MALGKSLYLEPLAWGKRKSRVFKNKPRVQREAWICSSELQDLGQVTSPVSASVSSLVKWEGNHVSPQGHFKELTSQTRAHRRSLKTIWDSSLFFYTKSQFTCVRFDDSREAGSFPRAGSTSSFCFQAAQLNECL